MRLGNKLLLVFISLFYMGCASTLPPAEPTTNQIEQADRIILSVNEQTDTYKKLGQYLTDKGFSIQNSDSELGTIQTDFKQFTQGIMAYSIQVNASIRDSTIHFYGQLESGYSTSEIENRGASGSPLKASWNKLDEIAKDFPHKTIYYSRN